MNKIGKSGGENISPPPKPDKMDLQFLYSTKYYKPEVLYAIAAMLDINKSEVMVIINSVK